MTLSFCAYSNGAEYLNGGSEEAELMARPEVTLARWNTWAKEMILTDWVATILSKCFLVKDTLARPWTEVFIIALAL